MNFPTSRPIGKTLPLSFGKVKFQPSMLFGLIILSALLAFELFNYSTTDFALRDLLGDLRFGGIRWATILSLAFCGIDFAGIARLFTPQQGDSGTKEVWYLMGAWLLAATMNAILTWWGVSMAISNHAMSSTAVVDQSTLTNIVPVFVALMVWVIRILVIGTLSSAGEKIFTESVRPNAALSNPVERPARGANSTASIPGFTPNHPASRPMSARPEPTYQGMQTRGTTPRPAIRANSDSEGHSFRL